MESYFADLDHTVLAQVFSLPALSLVDKLRCEQVCSSWRAILDCSICGQSKVLWADSLNVEIGLQQTDTDFRLHVYTNSNWDPVRTYHKVHLSGSVHLPLTERQRLFTQWLSKRQSGVNKLHNFFTDASHRVDSVLTELHNCYLQHPFTPNLHLELTTSVIEALLLSDLHQKLVCLLGNLYLRSHSRYKHLPVLSSFTNLTSLEALSGDGHLWAEETSQLHQLPLLHSLVLIDCAEVSTSILAMPCLRCLKVLGCLNNTYDFSCATQITQLTLSKEEELRGFSHLILPSGNNVQLLQLSLGSWQETPIDTLINLGAATSLESLYTDIFTDNGDAFWPALMPALTDLATHVMPQQPPIKWLNYTNLRGLTLECLERSVIPDWFSAFTQLTSLSLERAELKDFPSCVMQLSHLRSLSFKDIDEFEYPLELPPVIVEFAQWPYLSRLNFALSCSRVYSTESQHSLSQLKAALGHRSSLLIL